MFILPMVSAVASARCDASQTACGSTTASAHRGAHHQPGDSSARRVSGTDSAATSMAAARARSCTWPADRSRTPAPAGQSRAGGVGEHAHQQPPGAAGHGRDQNGVGLVVVPTPSPAAAAAACWQLPRRPRARPAARARPGTSAQDVSASSACLSADSASTLGPNTWLASPLQPGVQRRLRAIAPGQPLRPQHLLGLVPLQCGRHGHPHRHMGQCHGQQPIQRVDAAAGARQARWATGSYAWTGSRWQLARRCAAWRGGCGNGARHNPGRRLSRHILLHP